MDTREASDLEARDIEARDMEASDMADFLLLMHDDAPEPEKGWDAYFARLRASGAFQGGSAIGEGGCFRKTGTPGPLARHLTGFIRVSAPDLAAARGFLAGNPVYEAGGTVEIRALPEGE
jgi:hypothetical protein